MIILRTETNHRDENEQNGHGMDVDGQDKARKNSDKISGSRNLLEIKKTKERLKQIRENTPSIGMNVGLKDKAWLNTVIWDDSDQHGKQLCEREIPIKLDYTDPALVFPLQSKEGNTIPYVRRKTMGNQWNINVIIS